MPIYLEIVPLSWGATQPGPSFSPSPRELQPWPPPIAPTISPPILWRNLSTSLLNSRNWRALELVPVGSSIHPTQGWKTSPATSSSFFQTSSQVTIHPLPRLSRANSFTPVINCNPRHNLLLIWTNKIPIICKTYFTIQLVVVVWL